MNRRSALGMLPLMLSACAPLVRRTPAMHGNATGRIDAAIGEAIAQRLLPGAVFHVERDGVRYARPYGRFTHDADSPAVGADTVYDIASLTKVVATAPAILLLMEEGTLQPETPLKHWFPDCAGDGKEHITVRHLLTHCSGFPAGLPARPPWHGDAAAHDLACARQLTDPPGSAFRYSDVNYVLLGQLVQRVAGIDVAAFAQQRIYAPLGMRDTGYLPLARMDVARIAPTQRGQLEGAHGDLPPGRALQGVVHDPTARRMDGVAGSAGVFATAPDLARYCRMLLNGGELDGVRVLSERSVELLTTTQSPPGLPRRGMGMDIDSPFSRPRGAVFPVGSYGHTGFTGCILWLDPRSRAFYVFLSNRTWPDDKANILPLYGTLGTLAAQAANADVDPSAKTAADTSTNTSAVI